MRGGAIVYFASGHLCGLKVFLLLLLFLVRIIYSVFVVVFFRISSNGEFSFLDFSFTQ